MGSPGEFRRSGREKTADLLELALENALRGDAQAIAMLVTLIRTRYDRLIFSRLRTHRGRASTATMEDIFQESMVQLLEEIQAGELACLSEEKRRDIVGYFQSLCDRKLENRRKPRLDPLFARDKPKVPFDLTQDKRVGGQAPVPGDEPPAEGLARHQELLRREMDALAPQERHLLEQYLAGVPWADISRETGETLPSVRSRVKRLKHRLAERIFYLSPTAQIHQSKTQGESVSDPDAEGAAPTLEELKDATLDLPIDIRRAVEFVHLKGGSVQDLAKSIGPGGLEKAKARLERGYESLSLALGVSFPEGFSVLKS